MKIHSENFLHRKCSAFSCAQEPVWRTCHTLQCMVLDKKESMQDILYDNEKDL